MPTLIRLFVVLLVLAGLGFAGMFALTIMVDPGERDITIRIPARELTATAGGSGAGGGAGGGPVDLNDLPAPVNVAPRESSAAAPSSEAAAADDEGIQTVEVPE